MPDHAPVLAASHLVRSPLPLFCPLISLSLDGFRVLGTGEVLFFRRKVVVFRNDTVDQVADSALDFQSDCVRVIGRRGPLAGLG